MGRKSLGFILLAATIAIGAIVLAIPAGDVRLVAVLAYLLICPGVAFTGLLNLRDGLAVLVLGIGLSISLNILVSEVLVLAHIWSPAAGLIILGFLCLFGVRMLLNAPSGPTTEKEFQDDSHSY